MRARSVGVAGRYSDIPPETSMRCPFTQRLSSESSAAIIGPMSSPLNHARGLLLVGDWPAWQRDWKIRAAGQPYSARHRCDISFARQIHRAGSRERIGESCRDESVIFLPALQGDD